VSYRPPDRSRLDADIRRERVHRGRLGRPRELEITESPPTSALAVRELDLGDVKRFEERYSLREAE
jgi:hypothetical protein